MFVLVIDFDGVLFDQFGSKKLFPQVNELIKRYSEKWYLSLATRRSGVEFEDMLLHLGDLQDCFDFIIGDARPKTHHLSLIRNCYSETNNPVEVLCLIDHSLQTLYDISKDNHLGVFVNSQGLNESHLEEAIEQCLKKLSSEGVLETPST
jgi:hypothetical protein